MKKIFSFILVCALLLGCAAPPQTLAAEEETNSPDFQRLDDPDLLRYVQDNVYNELVTTLDSDEYFVENVNAVYVSNEYLEELAFNSQSNIFFGYSLEELDEQFQGTRYVFTLEEDGGTGVEPFEAYDDTYEHVIKNVAIGTGVILLCVTVSAVTAGGAPAVSMIFAASAKTGTAFALSSGALGGVSAGVVKGIQTGDFDEAVKAGALAGSETFKWGAISGAIGGGASEAMGLRGATLTNDLTMNQAAVIQRESKYPLDVIGEFKNMDQYQIFKHAGLKSQIIDNKTALIRGIDLNYVDESGMTNLERMKRGLSPLDPTGYPYELHHIGQKQDSTLAILTRAEHRQNGNMNTLHPAKGPSQVDHKAFAKQKKAFWKDFAKLLTKGGI